MDKKEQIAQLMQNPAFVAETQNVNSLDELIGLYNKYGVEVSAEDMAGMSKVFATAKRAEDLKAKNGNEKNGNENQKNNIKPLIAIIAVGLILFLTGVPKNVSCTEKANAVVVAFDETVLQDVKHHKTQVKKPIMEYEVDGVTYDEEWGMWSNVFAFKGGEAVSIRYNAANPKVFVVDKFLGFEFHNLLGLIVAAFAGIKLLKRKGRVSN